MTPNFLAFHVNMKAGEAIQKLRSLVQKKSSLNYVYVTDSENRLKGVLNMRDLLLANEGDSLEATMIPNVFRVEATMDREKVIQELSNRSFIAVPVIDKNDHLLGTIRTDELIASAQEEATEDIQKMFGAGGDEHVSSPISFSIRKRLLWLNPEQPAAWGFGDSAMREYEPHCDQVVVAYHLESLRKVIDDLTV
jgi:magnesium transporter